MEHKEDRLGVLGAQLLGDVGLVLSQELRVELDITGGVHAVHVAGRGEFNRIAGADGAGNQPAQSYPNPAAMLK